MKIKITNYRRFSNNCSASFEIGNGNTCFLGVNNSGKSSLLKFFIEFRSLFRHLSDSNNFVRLTRNHEHSPVEGQIKDPREIFHNQNENDILITFEDEVSVVINNSTVSKNVSIEIIIRKANLTHLVKSIKFDNQEIDKGHFSTPSNVQLFHVIPNHTETFELTHFLNFFRKLSYSIYVGPFRNIINVGGNSDYFDISIGESFIKQWSEWKTGDNKQNQKAIIRLEEEIKRIFEYTSLQINASNDSKTLSIVADSESYTLRELGAGIAQYIVVLANALVKQPTFILVDEPELNLHPALQLDFLNTLGAYANEGVIYATHTLGLAKSTADKLYLARKINQHESVLEEYNEFTTLSESLGELNYAGLKAIGIEKVLLVEGRTEIRAIQEILNKLEQKHKIVLLSLGGREMITANREEELKNFAEIASKSFALIDSEKQSEDEAISPKRQGFLDTCKKLGIETHVLKFRAFENYLSKRAINETFNSDKYQELGPYQDRSELSLSWGKTNNWRIVRNMTNDELVDTDLWLFLKSVMER